MINFFSLSIRNVYENGMMIRNRKAKGMDEIWNERKGLRERTIKLYKELGLMRLTYLNRNVTSRYFNPAFIIKMMEE